ncbi:unnamed protein product [Arabis nemorensis]|uniref:Uncharacterized protein n=1 Tax=Arabis nemorensis TaxID=586526 RepID=A0A565AU52_9BRAS|nr:unnamed protein product [Arabis nemorensis]
MVVFNSTNVGSSSNDNNAEMPLPDNPVLENILFSGEEHATWFGRDAPPFVDDHGTDGNR